MGSLVGLDAASLCVLGWLRNLDTSHEPLIGDGPYYFTPRLEEAKSVDLFIKLSADLAENSRCAASMLGTTVLRQLMSPDEASMADWDFLHGYRVQDLQPPPEGEVVR